MFGVLVKLFTVLGVIAFVSFIITPHFIPDLSNFLLIFLGLNFVYLFGNATHSFYLSKTGPGEILFTIYMSHLFVASLFLTIFLALTMVLLVVCGTLGIFLLFCALLAETLISWSVFANLLYTVFKI